MRVTLEEIELLLAVFMLARDHVNRWQWGPFEVTVVHHVRSLRCVWSLRWKVVDWSSLLGRWPSTYGHGRIQYAKVAHTLCLYKLLLNWFIKWLWSETRSTVNSSCLEPRHELLAVGARWCLRHLGRQQRQNSAWSYSLSLAHRMLNLILEVPQLCRLDKAGSWFVHILNILRVALFLLE